MILAQAVVEDGCFTASLTEPNIVSVSDLVHETSERLEFRDSVVKMSIGQLQWHWQTEHGHVAWRALMIMHGGANKRQQDVALDVGPGLAATVLLLELAAAYTQPNAGVCLSAQLAAHHPTGCSMRGIHSELVPCAVIVCAGFGHLVVCTSSHCHVYATSNFNTPHIFDLKEQPQLVLQCGRSFALLDAAVGLQVRRLVYVDRQLPSSPRHAAVHYGRTCLKLRSTPPNIGTCGSIYD